MKPEERRKLTFWTFFTAEIVLSLITFLACFAIFFYFTREVFLKEDPRFDKNMFSWAEAHSTTELTAVLKFITYFASMKFLISVPPTLIIFFLFFRKWRWFSAYILAATMGSFLLNQYLKNNFGRLRPDSAFYYQPGFSFPSGHAMIGTAFYGMLAYLVWMNVRNKLLRYGLIVFFIIWELLICYSRVYLNVHYATDVLAGLAAGIICLLLTILLLRQLEMYYARQDRKNGSVSASKTRTDENITD
jgi:membrane-associated phospholipid phosphatase